ncbi:MAG: DNA polymerase IV [Thiohalomonadaceae bacterium]
MQRTILHVDMDAFFAAVEIRARPELAAQPVIVGGAPERRGVVAAASYAARRYGIHSAMPTATALRLCPQAVLLPPRHDHYAEVSQQIRAVFERYTPQVEPLSLDEAFLDVSGSTRLFGTGEAIGRRIKQEIRSELGLVASVGVAPNKFVAKIASDIDKPDGFVVVAPEQVQSFLDPLPVGRLWGVGKVGAKVFARLGITTIGQLRAYSPRLLQQHLGNAAGPLWQLAHGQDERPVVSEREAKSISQETTFPRDIDDPTVLRAWLQDLAAQVAWRLRRHGLKGRTVQIKVRLADFSTLTRAQTLAQATDITDEIRRVALMLFEQRLPRPLPPLRLLGVGVSGFAAEPGQDDLFAVAVRERQSRLDAVMDQVVERYGRGSIVRGAGAGKNGPEQR